MTACADVITDISPGHRAAQLLVRLLGPYQCGYKS